MKSRRSNIYVYGDHIHVYMRNGKDHDLELVAMGKEYIYGLDKSHERIIIPRRNVELIIRED